MTTDDETVQTRLRSALSIAPPDAYDRHPDQLPELQSYGITPEAVGQTAEDVDAGWLGNIYRYQFMSEYWFGKPGDDDASPVAPIEFRTIIYTVGPPDQQLTEYLRDVVNPRQKTVFDTGVYGDPPPGYVSSMAPFVEYAENVEGPDQVGLSDLTDAVLGVPMYETEFYGEYGDTRGLSKGYIDPFSIDTDPPDEEVWGLSYNPARDSYQVSPPGRTQARERTTALRGKDVYVNGRYIGSLAKDGRTWLKNEYDEGDGSTYVYRGRPMWSREGLVQATDATYSAIRDGGNLYKVQEDDDAILLVTAAGKPDDFRPTAPDDVPPVGDLRLDESEATTFDIRTDQDKAGALGRYSTPATRDITDGSTFTVIQQNQEIEK
jgi:hypothetical protein